MTPPLTGKFTIILRLKPRLIIGSWLKRPLALTGHRGQKTSPFELGIPLSDFVRNLCAIPDSLSHVRRNPEVGLVPEIVPKRTDFELVFSYPDRMKVSDLTPEQLSSVPCPTCGVAARERCLLHSGTPRTEPHLERKLSAAEAIEKKRAHGGPRG
jgi:hypothetical protein